VKRTGPTSTSADDRSVPDGPQPSISEVFRRALPLLRSVFREYRIPEATARSAETDLTAWFVRYCRRNPDSAVDAQILALVSLTCSFCRGYARLSSRQGQGQGQGEGEGERKGERERVADPEFQALLGEVPEAVARRIASPAGISAPGGAASAWSRLLAFARRSRR
jgi:hypothetical protein